jgi:hypothetical protein
MTVCVLLESQHISILMPLDFANAKHSSSVPTNSVFSLLFSASIVSESENQFHPAFIFNDFITATPDLIYDEPVSRFVGK